MSAGKGIVGATLGKAVDFAGIIIVFTLVFVLLGACSPKQAAQGNGNFLWSTGVAVMSFIRGIGSFVLGMNAVGGGTNPNVQTQNPAPAPKAAAPKATQAPANPAAPKAKPKTVPVPAKKPAAKTTAGVPA